jgi:hypothetical protein
MSLIERQQAAIAYRERRIRLGLEHKPQAKILPFPEKIIVTVVEEEPEPIPLPIICLPEPEQEPEPAGARYPSLDKIIRACAWYYGVTVIDIKSARRERRMTKARHVAIYIARTQSLLSLPIVGRILGNRDHTTVLHAYRSIVGRLPNEPELGLAIATIEQKLGIQQNG